jgi:D-alanyl-lipoteichoic acid acyltransferase DltB (MBOAT superfamily)
MAENHKKPALVIALALSFGVLAAFKYLNFLLSGVLGLFGETAEFDIILPMGISFYTFQSVGYTIDVYRGVMEPQKNFFKFLLFITFFPQLVAGPIERAENITPQLFSGEKLSLDNFMDGGAYMILGYFKKVAVADRIAIAVNAVYKAPANFGGLALITAAALFSFQIYCDFSGYSDIAVGCAKCFGIDLSQNFRQPFLSKSLKEFWRRWHISLSSWFKDYVYFPLGGGRVSKPRRAFNTLLTFLLSGLWHGASVMFLAWGFLHGACQAVLEFSPKILAGKKCWLWDFLRVCATFSFVTFAFIFFRAGTFDVAFTFISRLFVDVNEWMKIDYIFKTLEGFGMGAVEFLTGVGCVTALIVTDLIGGETSFFDKTRGAARFLACAALAVITISTGVFYDAQGFIYFQF